MDAKYTFIFLCLVCFVEEKSGESIRDQAAFTEEVLRKELERFAVIQDEFRKIHVNISIVLSHSKLDANGTIIQRDAIELRPMVPSDDTSIREDLNKDMIRQMFDFSDKLNYSTVISIEKYAEDTSLLSKTVDADKVKLHYEDGRSDLLINLSAATKQEQRQQVGDTFDEIINNVIQQYEMPVEIHQSLFDDKGKLLKSDLINHKSKKVTIIEASMQIGRQLKVAEAVKRATLMKQDENDRLVLIIKYLDIQYSDCSWEASIGDGKHFIIHEEFIKLSFEGTTYTIWSNKKEE